MTFSRFISGEGRSLGGCRTDRTSPAGAQRSMRKIHEIGNRVELSRTSVYDKICGGEDKN